MDVCFFCAVSTTITDEADLSKIRTPSEEFKFWIELSEQYSLKPVCATPVNSIPIQQQEHLQPL